MCSQNYKNFLWACWPLSQNLTTGPCSNQLQRPPPLLDDTLTLQKQWELVDWMNFFASSFDSFTLTASYFLLLTFRNQMLVACFSFAAQSLGDLILFVTPSYDCTMVRLEFLCFNLCILSVGLRPDCRAVLWLFDKSAVVLINFCILIYDRIGLVLVKVPL